MNKMYMLYLLLLVIILIFIKIYTSNNKNKKPLKLENFVNNNEIFEKNKNYNDQQTESYYCGIVPSNTNENDEYLINQPDNVLDVKNKQFKVKPLNHLYYYKQANLKLKPFVKKKENTVPLRPQKYKRMITRDFDQDIRKIK